jgi:hypothetical protein
MTERDRPRRTETNPIRPSSGNFEFGESRAEGSQELSLTHRELDLKSATAERKHELDRLRVEAKITEEKEENKRRRERERVLFYVVVGVMVAGLVAGFFTATVSSDPDIRRFGQAIVTLILGAVAGYFTGSRVGK